jgi:hypothetical protein
VAIKYLTKKEDEEDDPAEKEVECKLDTGHYGTWKL